MGKLSAVVRATVTIEITVGNWDSGMTFDELEKIGRRESSQMIRNKLAGCGVSLIGDPIIKASTFELA